MLNHEEFVWGYNYIPQCNPSENNGEVYFIADTCLCEDGYHKLNEVHIRKSDISALIPFYGTIEDGGKFIHEWIIKVYMSNGREFYVLDSENEFDFDNMED